MAGFDDQTNATDRPLPVSPVFHGAGRFSAITGGLLDLPSSITICAISRPRTNGETMLSRFNVS